tara:strand:+ start:3603 stop:4142 length:540 start_codon:yes stop_codon:yes gene_type:complete
MEIFDLKDRIVVPSPQALLIPEFRNIWDQEDKEIALQELAYVYFISDYKSPYSAALSPEALAKTVAKDFMKDENYDPPPQVQLAINKYKMLQDTPSMHLLTASISTVHNLIAYLKSVDLQERDKVGKPIYKPNDVVSALSKIGSIVESLTKVRAQVEKETTQTARLRGQRTKGNREDPN